MKPCLQHFQLPEVDRGFVRARFRTWHVVSGPLWSQALRKPTMAGGNVSDLIC